MNMDTTSDVWKKVLDRSINRFVEDLDVDLLLDYCLEEDYLTSLEVRDIRNEKTTRDEIRKIVKIVRKKDVEGYKQFKSLLELSRQKHLAKYLSSEELKPIPKYYPKSLPKDTDGDLTKGQKYSCNFDGRLILLEDDQIKELKRNLVYIGKGEVGTVFRSSDSKLFGITIAVKKIHTTDNAGIEMHIRRERMACRLIHPFILPLLSIIEKSKEEFWFISPYCENGDLHAAIEKRKEIPKTTRVKILLQIALAIQYIHTEIKGARDAKLHEDIASSNVVLDEYLNARLIDFGLARGKDYITGNSERRKCYDHPKKGHGDNANICWDYYSFGVIIREMLTSLGPEGSKETILMNMCKDDIEQCLDRKVWQTSDICKALNDLSHACMNSSDNWTVADFEELVVKKLKDILFNRLNSKLFDNGNSDKEQTCHQCIINPIAGESSLTHEIVNCRQTIKVCMACEKNSFSQIICYCGEKLASKIGSRWGALLVAGDDEDTIKAKAMRKDIQEIERVITSQTPRIFGISSSKVKVVVPGNTEKKTKEDGKSAWRQIQEHILQFSEDTEIDTLLIYFSCHGGNKERDSVFKLGADQNVKLDDFQKELEKLKNIDRLILFLDRCFPPLLKLEDVKRKFVQINACSEDEEAHLSEDGSVFTKYVIQALKAKSVGQECCHDCKHCFEYWGTVKEYISVYKLFDYVRKHIEQEGNDNKIKLPEPNWQFKQYWENIAFFTNDEVKIEFFMQQSRDRQRIVYLTYLKKFHDVKDKLLKAFNVDKSTHEVEICKETFRNDQPFEECNTLQKVIQAWIQRCPLIVSFPEKMEENEF